jgi:hypothetical protein
VIIIGGLALEKGIKRGEREGVQAPAPPIHTLTQSQHSHGLTTPGTSFSTILHQFNYTPSPDHHNTLDSCDPENPTWQRDAGACACSPQIVHTSASIHINAGMHVGNEFNLMHSVAPFRAYMAYPGSRKKPLASTASGSV